MLSRIECMLSRIEYCDTRRNYFSIDSLMECGKRCIEISLESGERMGEGRRVSQKTTMMKRMEVKSFKIGLKR